MRQLSKAGLLAPEDRARASQYITGHIQSQLGLNLAVDPVSVKPEHPSLLERWLEEAILPLYGRHRELAQESVRGKIGTLRESVETALKVRLERSDMAPGGEYPACARWTRSCAMRLADSKRRERCAGTLPTEFGTSAMRARRLPRLEFWSGGGKTAMQAPISGRWSRTPYQLAAEKARLAFDTLDALAQDLAQALETTAKALDLQDVPTEGELTSVLKEMPRMDLGTLRLNRRPTSG